MRAPLVSVVMAVKDGQDYVWDALDSVLAQTVRDLEVIVVDDGSTDATADVLRRCPDSRVAVITNERSIGQTPSLNIALRAASGRFIARQDADDLWFPNRLAVGLETLEREELAIVGSGAIQMDGAGRVVDIVYVPERPTVLRWHLLCRNVCYHSSLLWDRMAVHDACGLYDEECGLPQDYDLLTRACVRVRVGNVARPLVCIRRHAGAETVRRGEEQDASALSISKRLLSKYLPGVSDGRLEAVRNLGGGLAARIAPADIPVAAADYCSLRRAYLVEQRLLNDQGVVARALRGSAVSCLVRLMRTHVRSNPIETLHAWRGVWAREPSLAATVSWHMGELLATRVRAASAQALKRSLGGRQRSADA